MIILIYGQDTYRSRQKLRQTLTDYQKNSKKGLNLRYFDLTESNFQDFKEALAAVSIFKEKKFFILNNAFANADFKQRFLQFFEKSEQSDDVILLYENGTVERRDVLFRFLQNKAKIEHFEPLAGLELKKWVKEEVGRHQATIASLTQEKLIDCVGSNLWQMSQEIKKLAAYVTSQKRNEIQERDLKLLVSSKIETDIFKTIEAIAAKNKKQALRLLHQHLEKGDSPVYLLSMINFQFRNLLIVKDLLEKQKTYLSILQESGLHPFVLKKTLYLTPKFTLEELKKIYRRIFQADFEIKTGKLEPQTALDLLIATI